MVSNPSSRNEVEARLKTEILANLTYGNILADKGQNMAYE